MNRLDLTQTEAAGLKELRDGGSGEKTKGAIEGAKDAFSRGGDREKEHAQKR